jgi:hypothetical protein
VDHVIVAAERLDAKAAYVACSRGRLSCRVYTPDKEALFDRLPTGNRAAALDMLEKYRIHAASLVHELLGQGPGRASSRATIGRHRLEAGRSPHQGGSPSRRPWPQTARC